MKKIIYLLAFFSLCSFTTEDPFATLLKKLEEYTKRYPTEKVHLHLDKPYYAAGDDIWFKAYTADARTSQPASESSILYVELINELDTICNQLRLPLQNGVTWGDFKLADTLVEGNYRIRAYTQLMRNAGSDFFFDKTIKIGSKWTNKAFATTTFINNTAAIVFTDNLGKRISNRPITYSINYDGKTTKGRTKTDTVGLASVILPPEVKTGNILATIDLGKGRKSIKTIPILNESSKIDLQFLPEGGQLVQGITSRVAIKALDAKGKGINVSGIIVDEKGDEITAFQTTHLGMGSFFLSPAMGKTYTAKIKLDNQINHSVSLPRSSPSGYVLTVNPIDSANVNIKVTISPDLLNKGDLSLIAHKDGMIMQSAKVSSAKQVARITLPNNKLPTGIVQLTLFSSQNIPVAERLVFINNASDKAEVELNGLKQSYAKRENAALQLQSKTQGNFSVAVTNTDVVGTEEANESNIMTSMLLHSDLKGYIENPNYYFMINDLTTKEHLDNLLLTQGWRKLDWKTFEMTNLKFKAEKSIRISGTITKDKKPLARSKISLMTNVEGLFMIDTLSDKDGRFAFEGLEFTDSVKFILQARSELGKKTVDIALDVVADQEVAKNVNTGVIEVNVNQSMQRYLNESAIYFDGQNKKGMLSKVIQLDAVTIRSQWVNPARNSLNLNGPGSADQVFDGKDMINTISLPTYLMGKMQGLTIKNGWPVSIRGGGAIKLIVDGMEMINVDFNLYDIPTESVESVEVLVSPSKFMLYRVPTMIVTTIKGAPKWPIVKYAPGLITYKPKGYYNAREFYSPKYGVEPSDEPDLRTTVFWAPNLVPDETGNIKFDYFNTDQVGNYRIVIEGFDIDGKLARKTYTFKVN